MHACMELFAYAFAAASVLSLVRVQTTERRPSLSVDPSHVQLALLSVFFLIDAVDVSFFVYA